MNRIVRWRAFCDFGNTSGNAAAGQKALKELHRYQLLIFCNRIDAIQCGMEPQLAVALYSKERHEVK